MIPQSQGGTESKSGRPPILRLNGYKKQFYNIPVVLSDMTIAYPDDVDYIECPKEAMVPIIQSVEITLIEAHKSSSARDKEYTSEAAQKVGEGEFKGEFDIKKYRTGDLPGY